MNVHASQLKRFYLAIELTPQASAELLSKFKLVHPKHYAHHVTLAFNPTESDLETWKPEGLKTIKVYAHGYDLLAQAVRVRITNDNDYTATKRDDGKYYHITVTVAAAGSPKDSNSIPDDKFAAVAPFNLAGKVKLIPKK